MILKSPDGTRCAKLSIDNSGNLSYNTLPNLSSVATGVIPTPVESIEEFKMGTSNQTADFANSAGSQVQMVTKRGTNELHGALYEYFYGTNIGAANTWLNNSSNAASARAFAPGCAKSTITFVWMLPSPAWP
jgi:hypothetical protein